MAVKNELPMPKYVPADKLKFLNEMRRRMHDHQSLRTGVGDIAVVVLTASELEKLINLADST